MRERGERENKKQESKKKIKEQIIQVLLLLSGRSLLISIIVLIEIIHILTFR